MIERFLKLVGFIALFVFVPYLIGISPLNIFPVFSWSDTTDMWMNGIITLAAAGGVFTILWLIVYYIKGDLILEEPNKEQKDERSVANPPNQGTEPR